MKVGKQILVSTDALDAKLLDMESNLNTIIKQRNKFRDTLSYIAYKYMTPEEMRENDIGLGYEEQLEMAYENIQMIAKIALE